MRGDWDSLDCPRCGTTHPPPDPGEATDDDETIRVQLDCVACGHRWEHSVEIWRYYGVPERLPSREEDR